MGLLNTTAARILTAVLVVQALVFYGLTRAEAVPVKKPLADLPRQVADWHTVQEFSVDDETQEILKADETLSRTYAAPGRLAVHLWIAYFNSQRSGQAPHSPKNCLPGNGWVPSVNDVVRVPLDGREPIEVNRYIIARGDTKSLVLYWYQSRDRVVASEYKAKFYVVADAMRYNRTDTALVRVMVPFPEGKEDAANRVALDFVRQFFTPVRQHLPA
jgi:EpsI family protein